MLYNKVILSFNKLRFSPPIFMLPNTFDFSVFPFYAEI